VFVISALQSKDISADHHRHPHPRLDLCNAAGLLTVEPLCLLMTSSDKVCQNYEKFWQQLKK
jgi:hypothetical protein